MKNRGKVNNGNKGALRTAAATMTAKTRGKKSKERKMMVAVMARRCFLSVQEVASRTVKKYSLLSSW